MPDQVETRLQTFTQWFIQEGGYLHPAVEFAFNQLDGVHLRCKNLSSDDVPETEILPAGVKVITCPHGLTLSALDTSSISSALGISSDRKNAAGIELPLETAQAVPRQQSLAAVWLCVQSLLGPDSFWKHYLDLLPIVDLGQNSTNILPCQSLDLPIFWTAEEKSYLDGSPLQRGSNDLESTWKTDFEKWRKCFENLKNESEIDITWDIYKWAAAIFTSRAFTSSLIRFVPVNTAHKMEYIRAIHDPDVLLYPGLDMLNHSATTKNYWSTDHHGFSLICMDVPKAGEQIFNSYGPRRNDQLLLCYGFTIPDNCHDAYPFKVTTTTDNLLSQYLSRPPPSLIQIEPSKVSEAYDLSLNMFYIRKPGFYWHDPLRACPTTEANQFVHALSGIPAYLITHLTGFLLNQREKNAISSGNIKAVSAQATTPLCCLISSRVTLQLMTLLLRRLHYEYSRLDKGIENIRIGCAESSIDLKAWAPQRTHDDSEEHMEKCFRCSHQAEGSKASHFGALSRSRRLAKAQVYLSSQRDILYSNIHILACNIDKAVQPSVSDDCLMWEPYPCLDAIVVTLQRARLSLYVTDRRYFDAAIQMLCDCSKCEESKFDAENRLLRARDQEGLEEDLWFLLISILSISKDCKQLHLMQWLKEVSKFYSDADSQDRQLENVEQESDMVENVKHICQRVAAYSASLCDGRASPGMQDTAQFWQGQEWKDEKLLRVCVRIVEQEVVQTKVRAKRFWEMPLEESKERFFEEDCPLETVNVIVIEKQTYRSDTRSTPIKQPAC